MGLLRVRLEVTCSCRTVRAAEDWPTAMSSWALYTMSVSILSIKAIASLTLRTFSGLIWGGGGMAREVALG